MRHSHPKAGYHLVGEMDINLKRQIDMGKNSNKELDDLIFLQT